MPKRRYSGKTHRSGSSGSSRSSGRRRRSSSGSISDKLKRRRSRLRRAYLSDRDSRRSSSGSDSDSGSDSGRSSSGSSRNYDSDDAENNLNEILKFGGRQQPFLINPYGPMGPWLEQAPSSSEPVPNMFGAAAAYVEQPEQQPPNNSLAGRLVNPAGYLSTWYGQPRIVPTSWNPLLYQGNNAFRQDINGPTLSDVVSNGFGYGYY